MSEHQYDVNFSAIPPVPKTLGEQVRERAEELLVERRQERLREALQALLAEEG